MTNELLNAAKNESDDSSEERYEKLKKEQAGTDMNEAEKRYEELKEEAKKELIEEQHSETKEEDKDDKGESPDDSFVTY